MGVSLDGYVGQFTDYYKEANNVKDSEMDKTLSKDFSKASDEELMDVCKQFEAYFLEQVFKRMDSMVPKNDKDKDSSTSQLVDYFKDTVIQDVAMKSTESNGLGLAQQLYESMKREYNL